MIAIEGVIVTDKIRENNDTLIYRGYEEENKQAVVIKTSRNKLNLEHEHELLLLLNAEGSVKLRLFEERDNEAILVMEDGGVSLDNLFFQENFSVDEKIKLMLCALDALNEIHQHHIIHQDIRSKNLLYDKENKKIKFINFETGSVLHEDVTEVAAIHHFGADSLPFYASPESMGHTDKYVDYRSDYYSLGVVFYELLVGTLPFDYKSVLELVHAHIARIPPHPAEKDYSIPKGLSNVIMKLLEKKPENRYQSLDGLREDLKHCLSEFTKRGIIEPFELGEKDISSTFQLPDESYGRKEESKKLMEMVQRSIQEEAEILFLTGSTGIGKTEFVENIEDVVFDFNGYFMEGHFEEMNQGIPYSGLIETIDSLVQQILAETPERYQAWKEELTNALSPNAQVLIDLLPSLGVLLGPQPELLKLDTVGERNRFNLTFYNFFNAIATPSHPLIMFLDNLQWADEGTLRLLGILLTRVNRHSFLLVLGARKLEEDHRVIQLLNAVKNVGVKLSTIELSPLTKEDIQEFLSDTLRAKKEDLKELAAVCFEKTQGNPFFLKQLLLQLYQDKYIFFDKTEKGWNWDIHAIQSVSISENVAEVITNKIKKLPPNVQSLLQWGACMGNQFDTLLLKKVCHREEGSIDEELSYGVRENLLFLVEEKIEITKEGEEKNRKYAFSHGRIQRAVYEGIQEEVFESMQLEIGRALLMKKESMDITQIASHFNQGLKQLKTTEEKIQVAEVNLEAGEKAKKSVAHSAALAYFKRGISLLPEDSWEEEYDLSLSLYNLAMESAYLIGALEEMEQCAQVILSKAKSNIDKSNVFLLKIAVLNNERKFQESIHYAFSSAASLGFDLGESSSIPRLLWWLLRLNLQLMRKTKKELLEMREASNPEVGAALHLIDEVGIPMFMTNLNLLAISIFKCICTLTFKYGATPEVAMNYMGYGVILCSSLKNPKKALEYGDLALKIADRFKNDQTKPRLIFIYYSTIYHWLYPLEETIKKIKKNMQSALDVGDLIYGGFSASNYISGSFFKGGNLEVFIKECENYAPLLKKLNQIAAYHHVVLFLKITLLLQGKEDKSLDEVYSIYLDEEHHKERELESPALQLYFLGKFLKAYYQGEFQLAYEEIPALYYHTQQAQGLIAEGGTSFFIALGSLEYYKIAAGKKKREALATFKKIMKKIKFWSSNCPSNYLHRYHTLMGFQEMVMGKEKKGIQHLEKAVELLKQNRFVPEGGIANELLAKLYMKQERYKTATFYLKEAYLKYQQAGVLIKLKQLEKEYGYFLLEGRRDVSSEMNLSKIKFTTSEKYLDFSAMMEFSRTISKEIVLEKLLNNLMKILLESSGAEESFLLSEKDNHWYIEAAGNMEMGKIKNQDTPLEKRLAVLVIQYVVRSKKPIIISCAEEDGRFFKDSYVKEHHVKSILAMPLLTKEGVLRSILYLENSLIEGAFTQEQLNLLNLLSGQITASIDNAKLYMDTSNLNKTLSNLNKTLLKTNKAYARFVPKELLGLLGKESIIDLSLGNYEKKEIGVLFSDIRGFTTISEKMTPEENFNFLNRVLHYLEPVITTHQGYIDKYMGDGIMAVFPTNADVALQAGIAMLYAIFALNKELEKENKPPLRIGIGLNTGTGMLSAVGTHDRMAGTVISDVVNVAIRLEELTKEYNVEFLISDFTYNQLRHQSDYWIRKIWTGFLRGKSEKSIVYEVFDSDSKETRFLKKETKNEFEKGVEFVFEKDWKNGMFLFQEILKKNPKDTATRYYLNFCKEQLGEDLF